MILISTFLLCTVAASVPEPVAGWRMELVAEAPRVKHPSVVACAPDGRVFVAEDPMDISLPNAGAAEGRILCFQTNGQITVFAEKLYAVFGLQYLEGKLYVLHNPRFTVFDDDNGTGLNRRDLIEQTLPDPSALNWNDHIPANFRLAMDGYFYAACGDKGLYRAQGTDGSTATLSSGGVFRIRPDGSELEVFCHGVRNILDVALNAEDEIFTYDNTDEHDWMGRFTHMVEAGFYGYPHDFIPQRPYTLWMMDDFGAGAACGAFAYNEDALPLEYHGNVFLADFGKRQVMRVRLERDGATYRVVSKEDLFPNPPGDFRPVGITLSPDGKSIYICDWQHRDEKAAVSVGRLWKLTWNGRDFSQPKPSWYLPAATGATVPASNEEVIPGLSHQSHAVRITAQRLLTTRRATGPLTALLRDSSVPALPRAHALWALDGIDGGVSARQEIVAIVRDANAVVQRQAIRQLGTRRAADALPALHERLQDADASIRFQAATALGRIGSPASVSALIRSLREQDLFARFAIFTALNRVGTNSPSAWPAIVRGLDNLDERVREGTMFAFRETCDIELLRTLVAFFRDSERPSASRRSALDLITSLHHRQPEWKGQWWAYHPALQPPPPKTERWEGTGMVLDTLRGGLNESDPALRRACVEGLVAARDTNSVATLRELYSRETQPGTRASILRGLGAMKDQGAIALVTAELRRGMDRELILSAVRAAGDLGGTEPVAGLIDFVRRGGVEGTALAEAITTLGNLDDKSAAPVIQEMAEDSRPLVRSAAVRALRQLRGAGALKQLEAALEDAAFEVRMAAVRALGDLRSKEPVPLLLRAYRDESIRTEAFFALARIPDKRALEVLLEGISSRNPAQRNAAHLAIRDLSGTILEEIEARADALSVQALTELRQIYAGNRKAEQGPLFSAEIRQHTHEEYLEAALQINGDIQRGRVLFGDPSSVNCLGCHKVAGIGSDTGPDLSQIGAQFDRRALAESILYPSRAVREGYQQINVETNDDEIFSGVVKGESADALILRNSAGREHRIPRASIKSRTNSALSLMPEGLHSALSLREFADLIAYLGTLKGE